MYSDVTNPLCLRSQTREGAGGLSVSPLRLCETSGRSVQLFLYMLQEMEIAISEVWAVTGMVYNFPVETLLPFCICKFRMTLYRGHSNENRGTRIMRE